MRDVRYWYGTGTELGLHRTPLDCTEIPSISLLSKKMKTVSIVVSVRHTCQTCSRPITLYPHVHKIHNSLVNTGWFSFWTGPHDLHWLHMLRLSVSTDTH